MSDITTLTIPRDIIRKAKHLKINCSEISRCALIAEINKKEPGWKPADTAVAE